MQEWWWQTDQTLGSHLRRVVDALPGRASSRKLRLFGVACCRAIGDRLRDERQWYAIEVAEQVADGQVPDEVRCEARLAADAVLERNARGIPQITEDDVYRTAYAIDGLMADPVEEGLDDVVVYTDGMRRWEHHVAFLRDIFGNPFAPVAFDPAWRTSTAVALARGMYDGRDFSIMPILADALQDAGCEDAAVLAHCRGDGPHVRGCWVVDAVLGKA